VHVYMYYVLKNGSASSWHACMCVFMCVFHAHDMRVGVFYAHDMCACVFRAYDIHAGVFCANDMHAGVFRVHDMRAGGCRAHDMLSPPNYASTVKVKRCIHDLSRYNVYVIPVNYRDSECI
jgi:hypothetical protein